MKYRLDIIGNGALGTGLAVNCSKLGYQVNLHSRSGLLPGASLQIGAEEPLTSSFIDPPAAESRLVIMATKAYDLKAAFQQYQSLMKKASQVLLIQNGYGIRRLAPPGLPVMRALAYGAAERQGHDGALWQFPLKLRLERRLDPSKQFDQFLDSPWVSVEYIDHFPRAVYEKLLINAAVNTLCALHDLDCRQLLAAPEIMARAGRIAREVARIAVGLDIRLAASPEALLEPALQEMGAALPSMLQDARAGRALEIEAIVDAPMKAARRFGVTTPELARLRSDLMALSQRA